jgi:hypothetical protein
LSSCSHKCPTRFEWMSPTLGLVIDVDDAIAVEVAASAAAC